jgi:hypothetical protein
MPATSIVLSVLLAALLGMLAAGIRARVQFVRTEPTFGCKMRVPEPLRPSLSKWPRTRCRAAWAHDVLLVQHGLLRTRLVALPATGPDRAIQPTYRTEVAGLGDVPVVLTLRLDDGRTIEVAARGADLLALAGPFLTAAIPGLPVAPPERPRRSW